MGMHDGHRKRVRERFRQAGLDCFADHEVLEFLLFYAIPRQDTNPLAHALMHRFGSLDRVLSASQEELEQVPGMGESAATLLCLTTALSRRIQLRQVSDTILNSVDRCGNYFLELLRNEHREMLYQVCLDSKGKLLSNHCLASGGVSLAALSIRQVVENALLCGASGVVLAHNHPSGIALPSAEDQLTTQRVAVALQTMDIRLVDHIIVADGDYVSMAASGMIPPRI